MSRSSYKRQGERRRKALKQKPFNILDVDDPRNQPRKAMKRDDDQTLLPDDMRVVPPSIRLKVTRAAAKRQKPLAPLNILDVDDPRVMRLTEKFTVAGDLLKSASPTYAPPIWPLQQWKPEKQSDGTFKRVPVPVKPLQFPTGWPTEEMITAGARACHDTVFDRLGLYKDGTIRKVLKFDDEPPRIQDRWREIARIIFNSMFPELPTA